MSETRRPEIKLTVNGPPVHGELMFDTPREGRGQYGPWWAFTFKLLAPYPVMGGQLPAGTEVVYYARTQAVAEQLKAFGRGGRFTLAATREVGQRATVISVWPYSGAGTAPKPNGSAPPASDEQDDLFGAPPPNGASGQNGPADRKAVAREYTEALIDAYEVVTEAVKTIGTRHGQEVAARLSRQVTFELLQKVAATLLIEAGRQRRADQIHQERRRA